MNWFHRHKWITIGTQIYNTEFVPFKVPSLSYPTGDITTLLQKCSECHTLRSKDINGAWTMEQLVGHK